MIEAYAIGVTAGLIVVLSLLAVEREERDFAVSRLKTIYENERRKTDDR